MRKQDDITDTMNSLKGKTPDVTGSTRGRGHGDIALPGMVALKIAVEVPARYFNVIHHDDGELSAFQN